MSIPCAEVVAALRAVVDGSDPLFLEAAERRTWEEAFSGDISFVTASGWRFVFFQDCGDLDYLDAARAPDGRDAEFDDWVPGGSCACEAGFQNPTDGIADELTPKLVAARHREAT